MVPRADPRAGTTKPLTDERAEVGACGADSASSLRLRTGDPGQSMRQAGLTPLAESLLLVRKLVTKAFRPLALNADRVRLVVSRKLSKWTSRRARRFGQGRHSLTRQSGENCRAAATAAADALRAGILVQSQRLDIVQPLVRQALPASIPASDAVAAVAVECKALTTQRSRKRLDLGPGRD